MPSYIVWDDECETRPDAIDIVAACEVDAAEQWADQAEAPDMFEDGRRIAVEDEGGVVTKWMVVVEYDPAYYASPVKPKPCCGFPDPCPCDEPVSE